MRARMLMLLFLIVPLLVMVAGCGKSQEAGQTGEQPAAPAAQAGTQSPAPTPEAKPAEKVENTPVPQAVGEASPAPAPEAAPDKAANPVEAAAPQEAHVKPAAEPTAAAQPTPAGEQREKEALPSVSPAAVKAVNPSSPLKSLDKDAAGRVRNQPVSRMAPNTGMNRAKSAMVDENFPELTPVSVPSFEYPPFTGPRITAVFTGNVIGELEPCG